RAVLTHEVPVRVLPEDVVEEHVLRHDHFAFHAEHFGDVGYATRTVAQTRRLDDDVDRGGDHFADGARGQRVAAHGDHRFETRESFAWAVGVERAHRAVMAGVHCLQQVECFRSAHLAHDDAFGAHTQAVLDEITHRDFAFTLEIGRPRFEAH